MTRAVELVSQQQLDAVRMRAAWAVLLACALGGAGAGGGPGGGGGARFAVTSTVLLRAGDARGGELGYRLAAALAVRPLPLPLPAPDAGTTAQDVLLHFTLESPQLMLRGKQLGADFLPRPSLWDDHPSSEFMALWNGSHITAAYLDSKDPPDVLNFKKALISLFQFQTEDGERTETDISGECEVQYEAASPTLLRKFKHRCMWEGSWDVEEDAGEEDEEGAREEPPARTERRRSVRYELRPEGGLAAVAADELLLLHGPAGAAPALAARAHTALQREPGPPPPAPPPASLAAALAQHPALADHALPLRAQDHAPADPQEEESLEEAVVRHRAALQEDSAGSPDAAAAVLALLPALRLAPAPRLAALLARPDTGDITEGLARALGLAGAAGAHAAAREAFQLAEAAPPRPELGREYLAALAQAPRVAEPVARDALRLAGQGGPLAPAALLAAAAAARRLHPPAPAAAARLQTSVKDYALKSLAKCKDEWCRATRLLALGVLRRGDVGALLLAQAERGAGAGEGEGEGGGTAARAALEALAGGPRAQRRAARRRLAALALRLAAPAALDARAAALDLLLADSAGPAGLAALAPLAAALRERGPRELRRVCWQALLARQRGDPAPPELLAALDPRPLDWCKRAHDGTSVVLERSLGPLRLRTVQLAERGVLRRGVVDLRLAGRPLLAVEVWARGLEALAAAAPLPAAAAREPEDEPGAAAAPEPDRAAAGLALSVAGVRRPDVLLFRSQRAHAGAARAAAARLGGGRGGGRGGGGGARAGGRRAAALRGRRRRRDSAGRTGGGVAVGTHGARVAVAARRGRGAARAARAHRVGARGCARACAGCARADAGRGAGLLRGAAALRARSAARLHDQPQRDTGVRAGRARVARAALACGHPRRAGPHARARRCQRRRLRRARASPPRLVTARHAK